MTNSDYAEGLERLAAWWRAHPEIKPPYDGDITYGQLDEKEEAAALVRAGSAHGLRKQYADDYFRVFLGFGAITARFVFYREKVCERVVVGVEEIPEERIEAHTIPASTKEIVEWRCAPILAATDDDKAAAI